MVERGYLQSFLAAPAGVLMKVVNGRWSRGMRVLSIAGPPGAGALLLLIGYGLSRRFEAGLPLLRHVRPQVAIGLSLMIALVVLAAWLIAAWPVVDQEIDGRLVHRRPREASRIPPGGLEDEARDRQ